MKKLFLILIFSSSCFAKGLKPLQPCSKSEMDIYFQKRCEASFFGDWYKGTAFGGNRGDMPPARKKIYIDYCECILGAADVSKASDIAEGCSEIKTNNSIPGRLVPDKEMLLKYFGKKPIANKCPYPKL